MEEMFECGFCNYINGILSNCKKILDIIIKDENITRNQGAVMFCIYKNKKITINEICRELGTNQGNTSSVCKALEKENLVKKIKNTKDERVVYMVLTEKGEEKINRINKRLESFSKYLDNFSNSKVETIIKGLENIDELLNQIVEGEA